MFTGSLSNGSLLKTIGYNPNGVQAANDGMSLFGNNTYTGSTVLNSGTNVATGTNATTSIKIAGLGGPAGSSFSLQGANGSAMNATLLQAFSGGTFILDNNAALGSSGNNLPNIPAAQNNDRIRDDAILELRDGAFAYRGLATAAASETFGSLNVLGGQNTVTLTPNGAGGTVSVTVNNNLSLAPRATMQVASTTLSAASKMFVNGTLPTADATGILPRMVGSADFLTYNAVTGLTPFTGYAADFSTAGTNVAISATTAVASSVDINALKNSAGGNTTLTIGAGQTLGITSGMYLNAGFGTSTITGGTLAFGSKPGVLFGTGNIVISSAVTGSDGLISARGTNTLSGDLSGLAGTLDVYAGTMNLNTNSFTGPISVRNATLNLNVSQTGTGLGAIRLGVPQNDANLTAASPFLSLSGAGANAIFDRDIIVDNGTQTAAGVTLRYSQVLGISPLGNTTGSQTINGNITLNSSVRLQGGGGGGTGATNFTGDVAGPGTFHIPNGRANFTGTISNAGGFNLGDQGFTAKVAFLGTGVGTGGVRISGGNSNTLSYAAGALPSGPITVWNSSPATAPQIIPTNNSTISNSIVLDGDATANVGAAIVAEWAGPLSGGSPLTKIGAGTLILSNASNSHASSVAVDAGSLVVNGALQSSSVAVANSAVLAGTGVLGGSVFVNVGGAIAPGNSIGTLGTGDLSILGGLDVGIDLNNGGLPLADLLNVGGTVALSNAALNLSLLNAPISSPVGGTFLLVSNDSGDAVSGNFGTITGLLSGYTATVDYAYSGMDSLGRIGDGNDIAVVLVPEPSALFLFGVLAAIQCLRRRRR